MDEKKAKVESNNGIKVEVDQTFLAELAELAYLVEHPALLGKNSLDGQTREPTNKQFSIIIKYGSPENTLDTIRLGVKNMIFDAAVTQKELFETKQTLELVEVDNVRLRAKLGQVGGDF